MRYNQKDKKIALKLFIYVIFWIKGKRSLYGSFLLFVPYINPSRQSAWEKRV